MKTNGCILQLELLSNHKKNPRNRWLNPVEIIREEFSKMNSHSNLFCCEKFVWFYWSVKKDDHLTMCYYSACYASHLTRKNREKSVRQLKRNEDQRGDKHPRVAFNYHCNVIFLINNSSLSWFYVDHHCMYSKSTCIFIFLIIYLVYSRIVWLDYYVNTITSMFKMILIDKIHSISFKH